MNCIYSASSNKVIEYRIGTVLEAISEPTAVIHCYGDKQKLQRSLQRLNHLFDTPAVLPPDLIIRSSETI